MIKTKDQIALDCTTRIQATLPSLHIDVDGTACKCMLDAFAAPLADAYNEIDAIKKSMSVDTASGSDLDVIGNSRNVYRSPGEGDNLYRYRIVNYFADGKGSSIGAMVVALSELDGVSQVISRPFAVGTGSMVLYLVPSGSSISSNTLSTAQATINSMEATGCRGIVRSAIVQSVQVHIALSFTPGTSNIASLKSLCVSAVTKYINSLQVGQALITNQMTAICINLSTGIADAQIKYLYINGRTALIRNFYPQAYAVIRPAANSAVVIS